jgi:putative salt-induced outer membrane protein YdiY
VRTLVASLTLSVCVAIPTVVMAQAPAPPPEPKVWTVALSAGLALTSGNKDTSTVNAAYDVTYSPLKSRNVVKSDGLVIHGKTDGELTANRVGINLRDEYNLTPRIFVFGQNQYLKDEFKQIDYLLSPTGGLGYKIIDTMTTKFNVDGSVGGVWEKNPGFDVKASGALAAGERLTQTLTATSTLTQSVTGLWKTNDLGDALYTFGASIAAGISTRTQLKVEVLNTYKTRPPLVTIKKNDVALLMAIVYKI